MKRYSDRLLGWLQQGGDFWMGGHWKHTHHLKSPEILLIISEGERKGSISQLQWAQTTRLAERQVLKLRSKLQNVHLLSRPKIIMLDCVGFFCFGCLWVFCSYLCSLVILAWNNASLRISSLHCCTHHAHPLNEFVLLWCTK